MWTGEKTKMKKKRPWMTHLKSFLMDLRPTPSIILFQLWSQVRIPTAILYKFIHILIDTISGGICLWFVKKTKKRPRQDPILKWNLVRPICHGMTPCRNIVCPNVEDTFWMNFVWPAHPQVLWHNAMTLKAYFSVKNIKLF